MSIWTHVNCNFRLADYQVVSDKDIYKVFGKQLLWGEEFNGEEYYLPMGLEESLHINIFRGNEYLDVSVFGDLRAYEDFDEIGEWFNKCCNSFNIEQAYCQVTDSGGFGKNFECQNVVSSELFTVNISFRLDCSPEYQYIKGELVQKCPFSEKMKVHIWENTDDSCMASTVVIMFGDFDLDEGIEFDMKVKKWFNSSLEKFHVRQAFCQINYANDSSKIYKDKVTFQNFE